MFRLDGKLFAFLRELHLKELLCHYDPGESNRPCITIIQVGKKKASSIYISRKIEACHRVGIIAKYLNLDETVDFEKLKDEIIKINQDNLCDAMILQLPIPQHLDKKKVIDLINPIKDVDCLTSSNQGLLFTQKPRYFPCTPLACINLIDLVFHLKKIGKYEPFPPASDLSGLHAVIVGRSNLVGRPMAEILLQRNATVTVCHSKTGDTIRYLKDADIVILATGAGPRTSSKVFRSGAIVIDVGIRLENGKLMGDLIVESEQLLAFTPVPGGVGPMTVQSLLENTFTAFKNGNKTPVNRVS